MNCSLDYEIKHDDSAEKEKTSVEPDATDRLRFICWRFQRFSYWKSVF